MAWGVYGAPHSLVFAGVWAERWEDNRKETGKMGRGQIRETPRMRQRTKARPVEVYMIISNKDCNQGSNMLR